MFSKTVFGIGFGLVAGVAAGASPPLIFSPAPTSVSVTQNPDGSWNFENIFYDAVPLVLPVDVVVTGPIDIGVFSVSPQPIGSLMIEFDFTNTLDANDAPYIQSIDEITSNNPSGQEVWLRSINVAGDLGSINDVHDLVGLEVGGDLGEIVLALSGIDPFGTGVGGNIFNVVVDGDVNGDVFAPGAPLNSAAMLSQGAVNNLVIHGSMTGNLEARDEIVNVTIEGGFGDSSGDPERIATDVRAPGDVGPENQGGIEDLTIGPVSGTGTALRGLIATNLLRGRVEINGNVIGSILAEDGFDTSGDELVIGGFIDSPSGVDAINMVEISAGNQVVLRNNADASAEPGGGLGVGDEINIGGVTIAAMDYELSDTFIGGGTLASIPWAIRDLASSPDSGSLQQGPVTNPALQEVTTGYYGPVVFDSQAGPVFSVTRVSAIGSARGTGEPVADIDAEIVAGSDAKVVRYFPINGGPGFEWGYEYTITPGPGMICAGSANGVSPPVHVFTLEGFSCATDLSGDGMTDSTDLAILLAGWGGPEPDLDGNGVVDSSDLAIVLAGWGACGPPAGAAIAGPFGPGMRNTSGLLDSDDGGMGHATAAPSNPVAAHFGFESVGDYTTWLGALSDPQLDAHLLELIEYVRENG